MREKYKMEKKFFQCFCDADNAEYLDKYYSNELKIKLLNLYGTQDGYDLFYKAEYSSLKRNYTIHNVWYKRFYLYEKVFRVLSTYQPKFGNKHAVITYKDLKKSNGDIDKAYIGLFVLSIRYDLKLFEEMLGSSYWAKVKFDQLKNEVEKIIGAEIDRSREENFLRRGTSVEAPSLI